MSDQVLLADFESADQNESKFLDSVFYRFQTAVEANGGDRSLLTRKATQAESKSSGYSVVSFNNLTSFRVKLRGKQHYLSIPVAFSDLVPESFPQKKMSSDLKYIRVFIDYEHPIESYTDFLVRIVGETVNRYPKEWDCCSRYMECSDAKSCVHPDKAFALACGYRKILNSGRIFYGKNRNID